MARGEAFSTEFTEDTEKACSSLGYRRDIEMPLCIPNSRWLIMTSLALFREQFNLVNNPTDVLSQFLFLKLGACRFLEVFGLGTTALQHERLSERPHGVWLLA